MNQREKETWCILLVTALAMIVLSYSSLMWAHEQSQLAQEQVASDQVERECITSNVEVWYYYVQTYSFFECSPKYKVRPEHPLCVWRRTQKHREMLDIMDDLNNEISNNKMQCLISDVVSSVEQYVELCTDDSFSAPNSVVLRNETNAGKINYNRLRIPSDDADPRRCKVVLVSEPCYRMGYQSQAYVASLTYDFTALISNGHNNGHYKREDSK